MLIAVIGTAALWLTFVWLGAAIVASLFSDHKGYGEKYGLMTGIVLSVLGAFIWAVWPAREISRWRLHAGMGGTGKAVLAALVAVVLIVGAVVVVTADASALGRLGLAALALMGATIAAALVKSVAIVQAVGGKTMAELRAEREAQRQAGA